MKEDRLQDKNFEQRLREEADHFEMQPSAAVWGKIASALPAHSPSKKIFIWKWAAAAAVILLIGGLGWYFLGSPSGQPAIDNPSDLVSTNKHQDARHSLNQEKKNTTVKITTPGKEEKNLATAVAPPAKRINPSPSDKAAPYGQDQPESLNEQTAIVQNRPSGTETYLQKNLQKNNQLPALQKVTVVFAQDSLDTDAITLQYSDRIARLMLEEAAPAAPSLARNEAPSKDKISVGLFFTPGVSYRTLKTGGGSSPQSFDALNANALRPNNSQGFNTLERVNVQDKPLQQKQSWGWNSGVRVALHLSPEWIVQTGISLRQTDYKITAYKQDPAYVSGNGYATVSNSPITNSLYARYAGRTPENSRATTLENRYLSTELPLLVGRRFGNPDQFSLTVLAGAGLTYLLHSNAVMYAPASQRYFSDKDYLHPFNSSLILEASMNVPLSKQIGFSIGPAFQYQLFSSYKNYNSVKEYPYLIGIKTALSLR